jgi:hypothetical protein
MITSAQLAWATVDWVYIAKLFALFTVMGAVGYALSDRVESRYSRLMYALVMAAAGMFGYATMAEWGRFA